MRRMLVHLVFAVVVFTVWVVAYRAACDSRLAAAQHIPQSAFGACDDDHAGFDDDPDRDADRDPASTAPTTRVTFAVFPGGD